MPIRIPVQSVKVIRDGKSVFPKLNLPFDFTSEEIDALTAANPVCLRKPIVEAAVAAATAELEPEAKPEGKAAAAAAKGGKADKKKVADDF